MKFFVALCVAVACVAADVSLLESQAPIVRSTYDQTPEGAFQYAYETANGIYAQAEGVVKNPNTENAVLGIKGAYRYTAPDNVPVEVTYTADENGYQAFGSAIPTAHPIPEYIARSLAYIATHPVQDVEYAAKAVKSTFQG